MWGLVTRKAKKSQVHTVDVMQHCLIVWERAVEGGGGDRNVKKDGDGARVWGERDGRHS